MQRFVRLAAGLILFASGLLSTALFLVLITVVIAIFRNAGLPAASGHLHDTTYLMIEINGIHLEAWQFYGLLAASAIASPLFLYSAATILLSRREQHDR